ncbi:MAG: class I SAM-dependent methyltransferase [Candidatus Obscuribacterales bacterium]|nr:class I SAM-dependent methyltransferase [Candidatus Obscuribacterales bacterium]
MTTQHLSLKNQLKHSLPPALVEAYRSIKHFPEELRFAKLKKELFGDDACMVPPLYLITEGFRDYSVYKKSADEYFRYFVDDCGLQPSSRVLDIGSGSGRVAVRLTRFLNKDGSYNGLDIREDAINWCKNRISSKFPNFQFQKIKVFNRYYVSDSDVLACDYKFPFEDNSFDLIVLGSVFTHMVPEDMRNYMMEISRVLKPNGKALITYFLLTKESEELIDRSSYLPFQLGKCRVEKLECPEQVIAHPEEDVLEDYRQAGLSVTHKYYGDWCGRKDVQCFQDIIIAVKPARGAQ